MSALKQNDSFHRQLMLPPVKSPGTYEVITALILENRLDRERDTQKLDCCFTHSTTDMASIKVTNRESLGLILQRLPEKYCPRHRNEPAEHTAVD